MPSGLNSTALQASLDYAVISRESAIARQSFLQHSLAKVTLESSISWESGGFSQVTESFSGGVEVEVFAVVGVIGTTVAIMASSQIIGNICQFSRQAPYFLKLLRNPKSALLCSLVSQASIIICRKNPLRVSTG
jgi:hypothetical protein